MRDEDLRNRWKAATSRQKKMTDAGDELFKLWDDQKRMQKEDKDIQAEIEASKKRAKELKKKLREHKIGETKNVVADTTNKAIKKSKSLSNKAKVLALRNKKITALGALVVMLIIGGFIVYGRDTDSTSTLGESTVRIPVADDLPRETPKGFDLLFPGGDGSSYDVVRISPDGVEPSYTYLDRLTESGQIFRVTQQKIPNGFDLEKTATDFQATSIIQIDDNTVYHGYSEQGGIQSLIFVKDGNLVSIRSPQRFSDDQWAAYIISLK